MERGEIMAKKSNSKNVGSGKTRKPFSKAKNTALSKGSQAIKSAKKAAKGASRKGIGKRGR